MINGMKIRLDEYDKTEWFDVARKLLPGLTEEDYEAKWQSFQQAKEDRDRQRELQ